MPLRLASLAILLSLAGCASPIAEEEEGSASSLSSYDDERWAEAAERIYKKPRDSQPEAIRLDEDTLRRAWGVKTKNVSALRYEGEGVTFLAVTVDVPAGQVGEQDRGWQRLVLIYRQASWSGPDTPNCVTSWRYRHATHFREAEDGAVWGEPLNNDGMRAFTHKVDDPVCAWKRRSAAECMGRPGGTCW